mmetsp:Transcript_13218/g.33466  ORF Transcript_13218/g.33466 Transcript_13218/m.33466 type:complete len:243 (+) Transcript_13218:210-938(+)
MADVLASAAFRAFSLSASWSCAVSSSARSAFTRPRSASSPLPPPLAVDAAGASLVTRVYSACRPFTCFSIACSLSLSFSYLVMTPLSAPSSGMSTAQMKVSSACTSARAIRSLWYKLFSEELFSASCAVAACRWRMSFTELAKSSSRQTATVPTTALPVALPPTRQQSSAGAARSGLYACPARLRPSSASTPASTVSRLSYAMPSGLVYGGGVAARGSTRAPLVHGPATGVNSHGTLRARSP